MNSKREEHEGGQRADKSSDYESVLLYQEDLMHEKIDNKGPASWQMKTSTMVVFCKVWACLLMLWLPALHQENTQMATSHQHHHRIANYMAKSPKMMQAVR